MVEEQQWEKGKPISWDEGKRMRTLDSRFFKPEANLKYILTFSKWELTRKKIPDYNDKTKMVEKTVLELTVDSVGGQKVEQRWDITSMKLQDIIEPYCRESILDKRKFEFIMRGDGAKRTFNLAALGDRDFAAVPPKKVELTELMVSIIPTHDIPSLIDPVSDKLFAFERGKPCKVPQSMANMLIEKKWAMLEDIAKKGDGPEVFI